MWKETQVQRMIWQLGLHSKVYTDTGKYTVLIYFVQIEAGPVRNEKGYFHALKTHLKRVGKKLGELIQYYDFCR